MTTCHKCGSATFSIHRKPYDKTLCVNIACWELDAAAPNLASADDKLTAQLNFTSQEVARVVAAHAEVVEAILRQRGEWTTALDLLKAQGFVFMNVLWASSARYERISSIQSRADTLAGLLSYYLTQIKEHEEAANVVPPGVVKN